MQALSPVHQLLTWEWAFSQEAVVCPHHLLVEKVEGRAKNIPVGDKRSSCWCVCEIVSGTLQNVAWRSNKMIDDVDDGGPLGKGGKNVDRVHDMECGMNNITCCWVFHASVKLSDTMLYLSKSGK